MQNFISFPVYRMSFGRRKSRYLSGSKRTTNTWSRRNSKRFIVCSIAEISNSCPFVFRMYYLWYVIDWCAVLASTLGGRGDNITQSAFPSAQTDGRSVAFAKHSKRAARIFFRFSKISNSQVFFRIYQRWLYNVVCTILFYVVAFYVWQTFAEIRKELRSCHNESENVWLHWNDNNSNKFLRPTLQLA